MKGITKLAFIKDYWNVLIRLTHFKGHFIMLELILQILVALATGFLTPLFLFTGSIKLTRWHSDIAAFQLGFMKKYGLNGTIYSIIGVAESAGALGLLLQGNHVLGTLAAAGLCLLSLGAFCYHLKFDSFQFGMPAMITAILSAVICFANIDLLNGLPNNLAVITDALSFTLSFSSSVPAAIGIFMAFKFAKVMSETADYKMNNPKVKDPYAA